MGRGSGWFRLVVLVLLFLFLPGCWDHREVEDLGIVLLTALDEAPGGKIRLEVQVLVPGAAGGGAGGSGGMGGGGRPGGQKPYRNLAVAEKTVFDAIRQLAMVSPRRLYFAHNQVIIISEQLARHRGIYEILDFFDRNPEIRRDNWVLVARGNLKEILDVPPRLETTPAQRIMGEIDNREQTSYFSPTRLGEFIQILEEPAYEPYTAIVSMMPNPTVSQTGTSGGPGPEPKHDVKLVGSAVFRRDRLAGWLNERETRGLLWVRGQVHGGPVKFASPRNPGKNVSVDILRAGRGGSKLEPVLQDGQPAMRIKIRTRVNLVETQDLTLDLSKPEVIKELEKQLENTVRAEVMAAVTKLQEDYHTDCLGFASAFHRKYPAYWRQTYKQWPEVFSTIPVEVEVKATIRRTGLVTRPMRPGGGEQLRKE